MGFGQGGYTYDKRQHQRDNYNSGYRNRGAGQGMKPKKHSGCRKWSKDDRMGLTAWNYSKTKGLVKVFVSPLPSGEHESENGRIWISSIAEITYTKSGYLKKETCMVDKKTGQCTLKGMGWILRPSTNYCGTWKRK